MTRVLLLALLAAAVAGCGGGGNGGDVDETATGPVFERGTVVIESRSGEVEVDVEIAETRVQRRFGLMHRESLGSEAGMVFLFGKETRGGFWMKNTLIPLSIAYFDADGRILRILDMEPCEADRCPVYDPEVAYRGALEVNKGAFAEWGVSAGDRVRVER
jgi:uncharacterized membrane protein (UPF0127 family)